jgi:hypothetical protein
MKSTGKTIVTDGSFRKMTHSAKSCATSRPGRALRAGIMTVLATAGLALAPALAEAAAPAKPPACYNRKEHAAEQMVRLHTELMVIGLTCQTVFPEHDTFRKYQEFTIKNKPILTDAEGSLIGHFKRTGAGAARFDTFRTELANEISRRVGVIGSYSYCQQFIPRANNALAMPANDLKTLASDEKEAGLMHLGSRPLCDVKVASLPDPIGVISPPRGKAQPPAKPTATAAAKPATAKPTAAKPATAKPATAKKPPVKTAAAKPAGKVAVATR